MLDTIFLLVMSVAAGIVTSVMYQQKSAPLANAASTVALIVMTFGGAYVVYHKLTKYKREAFAAVIIAGVIFTAFWFVWPSVKSILEKRKEVAKELAKEKNRIDILKGVMGTQLTTLRENINVNMFQIQSLVDDNDKKGKVIWHTDIIKRLIKAFEDTINGCITLAKIDEER